MRERVWLALVHHPILERTGAVGTTAVTTLDLHDLARLSCTYGLGGVYATTPLEGQRALVERLVGHWTRGRGGQLNPFRREALSRLRLVSSLEEAASGLESEAGAVPMRVATSARDGESRWTLAEARARLASTPAPVLLVFGTGWGLAPEVLEGCDGVLEPLRGPVEYNHLSVRSAASIVVDRLFGDR